MKPVKDCGCRSGTREDCVTPDTPCPRPAVAIAPEELLESTVPAVVAGPGGSNSPQTFYRAPAAIAPIPPTARPPRSEYPRAAAAGSGPGYGRGYSYAERVMLAQMANRLASQFLTEDALHSIDKTRFIVRASVGVAIDIWHDARLRASRLDDKEEGRG